MQTCIWLARVARRLASTRRSRVRKFGLSVLNSGSEARRRWTRERPSMVVEPAGKAQGSSFACVVVASVPSVRMRLGPPTISIHLHNGKSHSGRCTSHQCLGQRRRSRAGTALKGG
ncbi:hypothetical protein L1887_48641 [Cichorium endivia]|nr:hypothetical protein L1887_48641 [Cichorium endivia]